MLTGKAPKQEVSPAVIGRQGGDNGARGGRARSNVPFGYCCSGTQCSDFRATLRGYGNKAIRYKSNALNAGIHHNIQRGMPGAGNPFDDLRLDQDRILAASAAGQACPTGSSELLVQLPDYQNGFTSDLGCEGCGGDGQGCAEALVLPAPTTITEVRIWGIFQGGDTPTNDFTVRVHAHDPGTGLPVQPPAPVWSAA